MAARTVHYALALLICKKCNIENIDRFIAGELLPDAIEHNNVNHAKTHFKITYEVCKKLIDTKSFLEKYRAMIMKDDLYLGYYLHLIQDAVYRRFLYTDEGFINKRNGNYVSELHNDYALLNEYIINKYGLEIIDNAINIDCIDEIYDFKYNELLDELKLDFSNRGTGTTVHLTEDMMDRFIEISFGICCEELEALKEKNSKFNYLFYSWSRA